MTNRETWLECAVVEVSALLRTLADVEVPMVRVAAGWPSSRGTSTKKRVLGECWKPAAAEDGVSQIFLNPMLDDVVTILGVLTHELIHAWDKGENGHKGPFVQVAKNVGLTGPWTATSVGPDLYPLLTDAAERLGPYPHSKLTPGVQRKVQTTRMLKLTAEDCCGYIVRTTQKWVDEGMPMCPHGNEMEIEVK
jgi:hypothetical protein